MRNFLLAIPLLLICFSGCKPRVDEIISRHMEAMGGLQQQRAIQTIRVTQRVVTGNPANDSEFVIMRKRGNKFRMDQPLVLPAPAGQVAGSALRLISGCDGQTSWAKFGDQPARAVPGLCDGPADIDGLLMTYKEKGLAIELVGKERIEGKELVHLKLTDKNAGSSHFYLDARTFLVDRIVSENGGSHHEDLYSDYRKVDGIMVPFSDEMRWWNTGKAAPAKEAGGSGQQRQLVEKIEFNIPLDDSLFAMPPASVSDARSNNQ